jgi:hypothetical protein
MYTGIAVTTLVVASATAARLVKDLLIVRLIRTLASGDALSPAQRSEICARLASALGSGSQPLPRSQSAERGPIGTKPGAGRSNEVVAQPGQGPALIHSSIFRAALVKLVFWLISHQPH